MTEVERINALTTNARNTWFVLLAALVFVGITLMGVEHIDFYGVDRATTLPVINVDVPTRYFFIAAPLLIAAIYGYFHLYLIRLWDALSEAPTRHQGAKLGDAIAPWLVTDAALHLRRRLRGDNCTTPRPLEFAAMLLNIALAWVFGLGILYWLWWSFLPARHFEQTLPAAAACVICTIVGFTSLVMLVLRMRRRPKGLSRFRVSAALQLIALIAGLGVAGYETQQRTEGPSDRIAPLTLVETELTKRPRDWLECEFAKKDAASEFADRELLDTADASKWPEAKRVEFEAEWLRRRDAQIETVGITDLTWADFRNADLTEAFGVGLRLPPPDRWAGANLSLEMFEGSQYYSSRSCAVVWGELPLRGISLRSARLNGSDLRRADLAGADFSFAFLRGANLRYAQMEGADLFGAQMEGADLRRAQMEGANLREAQMEGADLSLAQMEGANLRGAQMEGADLREAQMEGADLSLAQMEGANLRGAQMEGANLRGAQMEGANLSYSLLTGTADAPRLLQSTNLSASTNNGGALRFVDFTDAIFDEKTDFRNAFMDGSVTLPDALRAQLGDQCQSRLDEVLPDEEFYGRWRGWIEENVDAWSLIGPDAWRDVEPIPPDPGCAWKTGPIVPAPTRTP